MRDGRSQRIGEWLLLYGVSVLGALVLSAMLVQATGGEWRPVLSALLDGSLRNPGRWGETLVHAAPLLLVALGTIISSQSGLNNIGQEGQLLVGAATATYFGFLIGGPGPLNVAIILLFGIVGGAFWASLAAGLRFFRGVPEVLSTLLLVTVASQAFAYALVRHWLLLAPDAVRGNRNQVSQQLAEGNRLAPDRAIRQRISAHSVFRIGACRVVAFAMGRTIWGFRLSMMGKNPRAAKRFGVAEQTYGTGALLVGGGFAGLAGGNARWRWFRLRQLSTGIRILGQHWLDRTSRSLGLAGEGDGGDPGGVCVCLTSDGFQLCGQHRR